MTIGAVEFGEQLFTGDYRRILSHASQPPLKIIRLHHDDTADHSGMLGAAVFSAKEVIFAGLRRLKPHCCVSTGNDIHLHAKRGNEKTMDNVLRRKSQLDGLAD